MRAEKTVNVEVCRISPRFASEFSVIRFFGAVLSNLHESMACNLQGPSVSTEPSRWW